MFTVLVNDDNSIEILQPVDPAPPIIRRPRALARPLSFYDRQDQQNIEMVYDEYVRHKGITRARIEFYFYVKRGATPERIRTLARLVAERLS